MLTIFSITLSPHIDSFSVMLSPRPIGNCVYEDSQLENGI